MHALVVGSGLAAVAILAPTLALAQGNVGERAATSQPRLGGRAAPIIQRDGLRFKDLNRSGDVEPYEDWRLTPDQRVRDLVGRMTLEEKAGTMMHGTARSAGPMGVAGVGTGYDTAANRRAIDEAKVTSMITRLGGEPASLAAQNNLLQEIAERTRLGIPITISTDPRHHFQYVIGASVTSGQFSQWPEPLGFAALGDSALVRRFGDVARHEYRAVGIYMALSPQADLATEPRWSRINGTFGEDADLAGRLTRAYVEGFQHGAAGAGGPTRFAIQCARQAEIAGAHGVLLLPHYLTEAGQEGLAAHVEAVCHSVRFGVIVYNRGVSKLLPETLAKLADRCPNLIGFKDGIGDIELMMSIYQKMGDRFAYLGGLPTAEVDAAAYKALGSPVYSSAVFNFIPKTAMQFYDAVRTDDHATQHRLLKDFFMPYLDIRNKGAGYAVSIVKAGATIVGRGAGPVRPPLTDLKPSEVEELRVLIEKLGAQ